jgi:hypothetical protein
LGEACDCQHRPGSRSRHCGSPQIGQQSLGATYTPERKSGYNTKRWRNYLRRGAGVGRPLGIGVNLGVAVDVAVAVGVAVALPVGVGVTTAVAVGVAVLVGVGVGVGPDCAQYLSPVFK